MCTSCRGVRGFSPGKILKTKNAGEAISGHFAKRFKVSNLPELIPYCSCFRRESPHLFFLLNVFEHNIRLKWLCHGSYAEKYLMPMWIMRFRLRHQRVKYAVDKMGRLNETYLRRWKVEFWSIFYQLQTFGDHSLPENKFWNLKTGSLQAGISNAKLEKVNWSSSHQRILCANHVVFAQQDSIKLERTCEHERSRKGVTAATLDPPPPPASIIIIKTERAKWARKKKQQQHFVSFSRKSRVNR